MLKTEPENREMFPLEEKCWRYLTKTHFHAPPSKRDLHAKTSFYLVHKLIKSSETNYS